MHFLHTRVTVGFDMLRLNLYKDQKGVNVRQNEMLFAYLKDGVQSEKSLYIDLT